ncbi:MAG: GNAT family N-acetyltransferase [Candidatus Dormibacteria bacterium]
MDVHPLRLDEAAAVAATLRHRIVVADRVERQRREECLYLVAWEGGSPVGQALLHRRRPAALAVTVATVDRLPYLEDVFVLPECRNRGIGTALLEAAERATAEHGDPALTLAVSVGNSRARRLYERLGYVEAGVPMHRQPHTEDSARETLPSPSENVVDLLKRIGPRGDGTEAPPVAPGTSAALTREA